MKSFKYRIMSVTAVCMILLGVISFVVSCITGCVPTPYNTATSALGGVPLAGTTKTVVVPPSTSPTVVNENGTPVTVPASTQPTTINFTIPPLAPAAAGNLLQTIAPIAGGLIPAPWGSLVDMVLVVGGGVLLKKYTSLSSLVAQATPGIVHLITQATDGQTLPSDITSPIQVAAGVTNLLAHSSASPVVTAINNVVQSVNSSIGASSAVTTNSVAVVAKPIAVTS